MNNSVFHPFAVNSLGGKLTAAICLIIGCAFSIIAFFYASQQEKNTLLQNERAIHQVLDSVNEGLQTVMITGSADVAVLFAEKLMSVKDVEAFRILRTNGLEAFRDNATIYAVNELRNATDFEPRSDQRQNRIFAEDEPNLKNVLLTKQFAYFYNTRVKNGVADEYLTFLLPIKNVKKCTRCHGKERDTLGVLEFTSSLESVRRAVREAWMQAFVVLAVALIAVLAVTMAVLRRYIVGPIELVSQAMAKVSKGDMSQTVPVLGRDELAMMASSFNQMTKELQATYDGFNSEHNKLSTIIMGTDEGIVVTDEHSRVVLVNESAERLLDKTAAQVSEAGFLAMLDEPRRIEQTLDRNSRGHLDPEIFLYQGHFLAVYASTIHRSDGRMLGHAAVIRDMTKEKRLEQMLRELSSTDPLTGLSNRRCLDETLAAEVALALEQERELSVLMFDIDHFKKFNDNYGHDQGDRVLQAFAGVARECVREVLDTVCRYGGEEFLVIARETSQEGAIILAERIREAVEKMVVDGLQVTTSIGVAGLRQCGAKTPSEMVEKADGALYQAKHAGRNKVMAAGSAAP